MKGSWPYFLWGMGWALWIPNKKILVEKLWNLPEIHCFRKARSRDFGWTFLGEGWRWKKQQMILEKCFDFCFSWLRPNIYLNMYFSPKRMWTKPAEFFTKSRAWYKTRQDSLGPVQNNQNIRIQTPHKSHPTFFFENEVVDVVVVTSTGRSAGGLSVSLTTTPPESWWISAGHISRNENLAFFLGGFKKNTRHQHTLKKIESLHLAGILVWDEMTDFLFLNTEFYS